MSQINMTVDINRSPAEVFTQLTNFVQWPQWMGGFDRIEPVSANPLNVGSQIRSVAKGGKHTESLMEITQFAPNQLLGLKSPSQPVSWRGAFTLEPLPTGTRLIAQFTIEGTGFAGFMGILIMKLTVKGELLKFKSLVEAG